ncbi:hypothetical protein BC828DRAFT_254761 [Blastocladiella britannica]|nr:hypothetical protein BC828DRAFT_254761 [Blastocladiella britannica]
MSPWGARSQMLPNTQGHAAVHIGNNQVLVFGGQSPFGAFSKTVMVLDYDGFEWNPVADGGLGTLPAGRMFHAMGYEATGNAVYVFGGQSATGTLGDTWQYSVTTATWAMIAIGANGPTARTNVAHATVGSSMYVYGGVTPVGAVLDDLWALDMVDGTWTDIKPLPSSSTTMTRPPSLQHATLVATNGTKLVLYGGTDAFGTQRNDLYVFSPTDRTWTLQTPSTLGSGPPPPVERMRGISVDWRRVIFTGGLGSNGGALNSTWVWKMDENAWSTNAYGPLPSSLHSHALVGFNQSANPNACAWTIPGLSLCTPATNITLLAISGATGIPGGGVMVSFANQDPLPPPAGAIDPGAKWAVTAINAVGLVGTLALVGFCVVHRGHKVVKASNPRFAVLILLGAALAHVGLISSTWQTDGRRSYMLTAFLVGTGYSLIFSALVVKTYMIYSCVCIFSTFFC